MISVRRECCLHLMALSRSSQMAKIHDAVFDHYFVRLSA